MLLFLVLRGMAVFTGEAGFSFGPAVDRSFGRPPAGPLARPWEAVAAKFSSGGGERFEQYPWASERPWWRTFRKEFWEVSRG